MTTARTSGPLKLKVQLGQLDGRSLVELVSLVVELYVVASNIISQFPLLNGLLILLDHCWPPTE